MKNYSDAYLLTKPFSIVAKGWDSLVFVDEENPEIVLKLYDFLSEWQLRAYYQVHKKYAQLWAMKAAMDSTIILSGKTVKSVVVNILALWTGKEQIIAHEDWLLTTIPRVRWMNLNHVEWEEHSFLALEYAVKNILRSNGIPILGANNNTLGHTLVRENIMVQEISDDWCAKVVVTDLWARILECLEVEKKMQ